MAYILLIFGFVLLVKGADFFVDGAASLAYRFHIPTVVVGLTIVAIGTSLPEFSVSISASLAGSNALAVSNVIGSNIFNTLVVVGVSAILAPFVIDKEVIHRDLIVNIFITVLLGLFAMSGQISQWQGLVLIACLIVYISYLIYTTLKNRKGEDEEKEILSLPRCLIYIVAGAVAIMFGGDLTVDNACIIAAQLGMSQTLIGLTIVALGTSLPELVTSVVAAKKGESGLSLGNAIGSNIFNILFILGFSASIHTLPVTPENQVDIWILLAIAMLIFALSKIKDKMNRQRGWLFLALYFLYMFYIIFR
jgi:cation:H+ antiporter